MLGVVFVFVWWNEVFFFIMLGEKFDINGWFIVGDGVIIDLCVVGVVIKIECCLVVRCVKLVGD